VLRVLRREEGDWWSTSPPPPGDDPVAMVRVHRRGRARCAQAAGSPRRVPAWEAV